MLSEMRTYRGKKSGSCEVGRWRGRRAIRKTKKMGEGRTKKVEGENEEGVRRERGAAEENRPAKYLT